MSGYLGQDVGLPVLMVARLLPVDAHLQLTPALRPQERSICHACHHTTHRTASDATRAWAHAHDEGRPQAAHPQHQLHARPSARAQSQAMLASTLRAQVLCWEAVRCPTQGLHDSIAHLPEANTLARAARRAPTVSKEARQRGVRSQLCVLIQLLPEAPICAQRHSCYQRRLTVHSDLSNTRLCWGAPPCTAV